MEEQAVRMSSRVAAQGGAGNMEERHLAQQPSRDLSGTNLTLYNSFAALDDDVIMHRALEMGVDASSISLDHINSLKKLEIARHSLQDRKQVENEVDVDMNEKVLFLDWKGDSNDEE